MHSRGRKKCKFVILSRGEKRRKLYIARGEKSKSLSHIVGEKKVSYIMG